MVFKEHKKGRKMQCVLKRPSTSIWEGWGERVGPRRASGDNTLTFPAGALGR